MWTDKKLKNPSMGSKGSGKGSGRGSDKDRDRKDKKGDSKKHKEKKQSSSSEDDSPTDEPNGPRQTRAQILEEINLIDEDIRDRVEGIARVSADLDEFRQWLEADRRSGRLTAARSQIHESNMDVLNGQLTMLHGDLEDLRERRWGPGGSTRKAMGTWRIYEKGDGICSEDWRGTLNGPGEAIKSRKAPLENEKTGFRVTPGLL